LSKGKARQVVRASQVATSGQRGFTLAALYGQAATKSCTERPLQPIPHPIRSNSRISN